MMHYLIIRQQYCYMLYRTKKILECTGERILPVFESIITSKFNIKHSFLDIQMKKVFYPFIEQPKSEYKPKNEEWVVEENFLNLWGYLRRRYPKIDLEDKKFIDLIELKTSLEGPRELREWNEAIASVLKH